MTVERRSEFPTWCVVVAIYAAWLALTLGAARLPVWVVVPLGGYLVAWHGSLQHELIHGHPTRWRWVNTVLAMPPLGVWLPFPIYRSSHLAHHATPALTDPWLDPESHYVDEATWLAASAPRRALWWTQRTLLGRLLLGPFTTIEALARDELRRLRAGDRSHVGAWLIHAALVAGVALWVTGVCGVAWTTYLAAFVYPGLVLAHLRGFAEHRPGADQARRSAIVETGPLTSLLFLNNNLHVVHHAHPDLPWFELPGLWRRQREALLAANGGLLYRGYLDVLLRFAVRPKDAPWHPGDAVPVTPLVAGGRLRGRSRRARAA